MKIHVKRHAVVQPQDESYRLIPLTQNQNAIVDAADFEFLSQWNWQANWNASTQSFYASRSQTLNSGKNSTVRMHHEILGYGQLEQGDHINGDTLDNRRSNLRRCSSSQNRSNSRGRQNRSGFKGVSWRKDMNKWQAAIAFKGNRYSLGCYADARKAAEAYDGAAKIIHGEFAALNFTGRLA